VTAVAAAGRRHVVTDRARPGGKGPASIVFWDYGKSRS
jgi:hypothetical protein